MVVHVTATMVTCHRFFVPAEFLPLFLFIAACFQVTPQYVWPESPDDTEEAKEEW